MTAIPSELSMTKSEAARMAQKSKTVAILGGTGKVGGWILEMALDRGYTVRALARSPSKLSAYEKLQVVKGGVDEESVRELVTGADVVISALGSTPKVLIVEEAAKVLCKVLETMDQKPRVVFITSIGINDAIPQANKYGCSKNCCPSCSCCCGYGVMGCCIMKCVVPYLISNKIWNDMGFAEDVINATEVSSRTTIVRPTNNWPASENAAFSKEWRAEGGATEYLTKSSSDNPPNIWISRRAIASFCVDCVEDSSYDGKAVSLFQGSSKNSAQVAGQMNRE